MAGATAPFSGNIFDSFDIVSKKRQTAEITPAPAPAANQVRMLSDEAAPTLEGILSNYFQNADVGTVKKSTDTYQKTMESFSNKIYSIASQLRATYNIKSSISDKQIVEEFLKQNNTPELLDSMFGTERQQAEALKKRSAYGAVASDMLPDNAFGRQVDEYLVKPVDMLESGTYGLLGKATVAIDQAQGNLGPNATRQDYAKQRNIALDTNLVEDLVNLAGAASRLGAMRYMPKATALFSLASELPGSRQVIEGTIGRGMQYLTQSK